LNTSLPVDVDPRLATLGDVLSGACPQIEFAYLFGSTAANRATSRSDIDLALYLSSDADAAFTRLEAGRIAARHLGTDALDIVILNTAPIALAGRVLTSRRVLIDRHPSVRHRYESATARLFQDFRIREHRLLTRRYARG
jgi:predicted nucleotidyltransferase